MSRAPSASYALLVAHSVWPSPVQPTLATAAGQIDVPRFELDPQLVPQGPMPPVPQLPAAVPQELGAFVRWNGDDWEDPMQNPFFIPETPGRFLDRYHPMPAFQPVDTPDRPRAPPHAHVDTPRPGVNDRYVADYMPTTPITPCPVRNNVPLDAALLEPTPRAIAAAVALFVQADQGLAQGDAGEGVEAGNGQEEDREDRRAEMQVEVELELQIGGRKVLDNHDIDRIFWDYPRNGRRGTTQNRRLAYQVKLGGDQGSTCIPFEAMHDSYANATDALVKYWIKRKISPSTLQHIRTHLQKYRDITSPIATAMISRLNDWEQEAINYLIGSHVPRLWAPGMSLLDAMAAYNAWDSDTE